jgi:hypothetical protein
MLEKPMRAASRAARRAQAPGANVPISVGTSRPRDATLVRIATPSMRR